MRTKAFFNISDEQLIQDYLKGNNNSLGILYSRYYSKVYQKCLSFTKNADNAFDLTQDILMKAFTKISTCKGNSKFSTWLYAIAHNYCITATSKTKNDNFEDISMEQNIVDESPDMDELEQRKEYEEKELKLKSVLADVPEIDRNFLNLKYHLNYSVKDLQAEYKLSASAVKMRLMRARQKVEQGFYKTAI
jgi:RNA polymerase sigma-70 factor (ECF subfamily)